jgi:hypothetical protein
VQTTTARPKITVAADGRGVASHAGSRVLVDLAGATGLDQAFGDAVGGRRQRRSAHDPGKVLTDLTVLLADGGETISDLSILRNQPGVFGPVASTATAWRVLEEIDNEGLDRLRTARALARERACWPAPTSDAASRPSRPVGWPGHRPGRHLDHRALRETGMPTHV